MGKIDTSKVYYLNDPSELDNLPGGIVISFKCTKCGDQVTRNYFTYRKDQCSVFMCKSCKTATNNYVEGTSYEKDRPIEISSPNEFDNMKSGSWFTFKCEVCDKQETHQYYPYRRELYSKFLCKKHKTESTNIEVYGRAYNIGTPETIEKSLNTQREKHGGKLWQQTVEGREHLSEINKDHPEWNAKAMNSYKEKTGYHTPFANPEVQAKSREHERENHGGLLHIQTEESKRYMSELNKNHPEWVEKRVQSNKDNHGGLYHSQTPEFRDYMVEQNALHPEWAEKSTKALMDTYGVNSPVKIPGVLDKIAETDRNNHGGVLYAQTEEGRKMKSDISEKHRDRHALYRFDGEYFDSSWEIKYWIYYKDHGIKISRVYTPYRFTFNGEDWHRYTPDFNVDGMIVDIKGDHLWEEKSSINDKPEYNAARMKCALDNGVKILYGEDISKELSYVDTKYGPHYIDQFKVEKPPKVRIEYIERFEDDDHIIENIQLKKQI